METETEFAIAAAAPLSAARRESWFRNWRLAWVSAGVLAAMVTVAYVVHVRRLEIAAEQAKDAREAATRNADVALAPQTPRLGQQAAPPPAPANAQSVPKSANQQPPTLTPKQLALAPMTPPAGQTNAMSSSHVDELAPAPGVSGTGYPAMRAGAENELKPALTEKQREQGRVPDAVQVGSLVAEKQQRMSANNAARRAEPIGGMLAPARPLAQIDAKPAHTRSLSAALAHQESSEFSVSQAKPTELPSGLPAVSTARRHGSSLAVDGSGLVFLSEDSGISWESVAKQWSGRAVAIRVEPVMGGNERAESWRAGIFEIVNDQGQVWMSTDGRNWQSK